MAKIAFVLGELPYPLDKGAKIRTFHLLSSLCRKHKVYLFGLEEKEEGWKVEELKKICERVFVFKREMMKKGWSFYKDLFLNLFSKWPYLIKRGYSSAMAKEITGVIEKDNIDLIICDSLQQTPNVIGINGVPKILNTHNVELVIRERHRDVEKNIIKKAYLSVQLNKLKKYESAALRSFKRAFAVSEDDKDLMASRSLYPESDITVIPNGVDCFYYGNMKETAIPHNLVFTGSMDWIANDDAMVYFLNEIFPIIRQEVPDVSLTISGRNPSARLKKMCGNNGSIELTGYVDDIRPVIAKCEVYVVPLRIGGGTRLKILEAMAMQKPVVSTSIGCEGLDVKDGKNIAIADGPREFANMVISLFQDREKAYRIAINGRNLAEEKYDWKVVTEGMEPLIKELC